MTLRGTSTTSLKLNLQAADNIIAQKTLYVRSRRATGQLALAHP